MQTYSAIIAIQYFQILHFLFFWLRAQFEEYNAFTQAATERLSFFLQTSQEIKFVSSSITIYQNLLRCRHLNADSLQLANIN